MADVREKHINDYLIKDVVGPSREIHTIRASATVSEVVAFLAKHHISSAPIVDGQDLLVGSIDHQDILHHLTAFGVGRNDKDAVKSWDRFRAVYLSDVSSRNPLLRLTPSDKLTEALELLSSGVHHIIIVDENNRRKVVNILSQFDLLKFLDANSDLIPLKKLLHSVGSMEVGVHAAAGFKLHAVLPTESARDAFVKMRLVGARALPIVSGDGKLMGQISAGDISLLFDEGVAKMALLDLPCFEYAKRVHEKNGREMLIYVDGETNFSGVLSLMKQHKVHRVLVTDNLIALRGIISVSDIAMLLL